MGEKPQRRRVEIVGIAILFVALIGATACTPASNDATPSPETLDDRRRPPPTA